MKNKELKVSLIASGLICLLFSSGLFVVFTPFPLYYASLTYGKSVNRKVLFFSTLFIVLLYLAVLPILNNLAETWSFAKILFMLPGTGLTKTFSLKTAQFFGGVYFLYFLLFGILFSEGSFRKWKIAKWYVVSVGGTFALLVGVFVLLSAAGIPVVQSARGYMESVFNEIIVAQEAAGMEATQLYAVKESASQIISFSLAIIPSILVLIGLFVATVNMVLVRYFVKVPARFKHFGNIAKFSLPHYLTWVTIGTGFLFFLDKYVMNKEWLGVVSINLLLVLGGIYFLQGLVIVSVMLKNFRSKYFKFFIYFIIIAFIQAVGPVVAIIGFSDLWIDFRRFVRKEDKGRSE